MSNVIKDRVVFFLKQHQPFNALSENDLSTLADDISLQYFKKNNFIFKINDLPSSHFYVLFEGSVLLTKDIESNDVTIDALDVGDIFGIRPLLIKQNYILNAKAQTDVILLNIPFNSFESLLSKYPDINRFFLESLALQSQERSLFSNSPQSFNELNSHEQVIKYNNKFVYTNKGVDIKSIAQKNDTKQSWFCYYYQRTNASYWNCNR